MPSTVPKSTATSTTAETAEQRIARVRAQEQADREYRATLPPIGAIGVSMGNVEGYNPDKPRCGRCGRDEPIGAIFGVTAPGIPGKLCEGCTEAAGPYGKALAELVEGVEQIDSAIHFAETEHQADLIRAARLMVGTWLPKRFGLSDGDR